MLELGIAWTLFADAPCRKYKGSKIEWDADECAQPLERAQPRWAPRERAPPVKKPLNPMANRFHLLNLDDQGDGDESEMAPGLRTRNSVDIAA